MQPEGVDGRPQRGRAAMLKQLIGLGLAATLVGFGALSVFDLVGRDRHSPAAAAAAAAARESVVGYEVVAAARSAVGDEPVARQMGIDALREAHARLAAGPPEALQAVAADSGRADTVAASFAALGLAADDLMRAVESSRPASGALVALERRAELFRLGIDALLFDIRMATQTELALTRTLEVALIALAAVLLAGLLALGVHSRRRAAGGRPASADHDRSKGRALLIQALGDAITRASRSGSLAALLLGDIDLFKAINDRHGPEIGDLLLGQVRSRLRAAMRDSDTVAMMGGDEFAVVIEGVQRPEDAGRVAEKLLAALAEPFEVGDLRLYITASVGIVLYPLDGIHVDELLREADVAMYAAKEAGRNRYQFSTHELRERTSERLSLIEGLRRALQRTNELELVYQPKIDVVSGELVGVEALLRWHHPELGTVLPDRFIRLAEETDLIVPLGRWVLSEACAQAELWRRAGQERLKVSVNVSSRQLRHGDLVETITGALTEAGLDPRWLEVELTEGTLAEDVVLVRRTLERLKAMGVQVSIDDFGTGYSSLSYLKRFPIDALKIDRSFIRDVTEDPDDAAISQAIVSLARSLRLQVVAEGVETPEQLEFVRGLGCDTVQGFLISRPLPVDAVDAFVIRLDARAVV